MWDHTDGCSKQYPCASEIYLLTYIALNFIIIIDSSVGAPGHGKYVVDDLNVRKKMILNLSMENILSPELIRDNPHFSS